MSESYRYPTCIECGELVVRLETHYALRHPGRVVPPQERPTPAPLSRRERLRGAPIRAASRVLGWLTR